MITKPTSGKVEKDQVMLYSKRLIVAGSRSFNQYRLFRLMLAKYLHKVGLEDLVIISGVARDGPDAMVLEYAKENGIPWAEYPADWNGPLRRGAGYARNAEMNAVSTHLLAFWDCVSRGTSDMIEISEAAGKKTTTVLVYPDKYYEAPYG